MPEKKHAADVIEKCYYCGCVAEECECEEFGVCECYYTDVDWMSAAYCRVHNEKLRGGRVSGDEDRSCDLEAGK